eukprot:11163539-Ditylum_brightwellii.AAC.1
MSADYPKLDKSALLNDSDHQKYQMSIGMLNWVIILSQINITYTVSFLSPFVACPRKGHRNRALYVFGYLKKKPKRQIRIDSHDPIVVKNSAEGNLDVDLLEKLREQYLDAEELLDNKVPTPLFEEIVITAYIDSDHAHHK